MAFRLAEAFVQLSARGMSPLMSGINSVQGKLAGLASLATGPLAAGMAALGAVAGVAGMLKLAADAEQTEIAFTTMLGSADAAKKMIGELNQFAAATPFNLPGIHQATKTLLSFGTSQENVLPLLHILGDVSAGTGKDLDELAVIFGQISATGKLTGGDLMQLTNAGVPMLKVLGQQLGKTEGEIKKMVEQGQIGVPQVVGAFQKMSGEGGLFAGMMEKQSGSLAGLWSTLQDGVTQGLTKVGSAIVDGFNLKGAVSSMSDFVNRVLDDWLPFIVSGFQWVGSNIVRPIGDFVQWTFGIFGNLISWFGSAVWPQIVSGFQWVWDSGLRDAYDFASMVVQAIKDVVGNFDLYWQLAGLHVVNFAVNAWERIKTFAINVVEIIGWGIDNWRDVLFTGLDYMLTVIINLGENIRAMWQGVLDFVSGNGFNVDFKPLTEGFRSAISEMPELTKANLNILQPEIDNVYKQLEKRHAEAANNLNKDRRTDQPDAPGKPALDMSSFGSGAATGGGKDKASFVGIAQLAEQMQQAASQKAMQQKQVDIATSQADSLKRLVDKATGEGLKVAMSAAKSPVVNWAFGGGGDA